MGRQALKTEAITVRVTPAQRKRILRIAKQLGSEGSLSVGIRWLLEIAPPVKGVQKKVDMQNVLSGNV